ncbi:electron transfer flavoprotein subunit alpha/FixB family protein [uncultured Cellulomonas sp.]|uniref:electron transfer flavoprotein subunit alpha/FixB family protein n=1 Tax=uncultured Cellulomonas sp. TaxID=189682 RepID=UPI00260A6B95|nr:FAD-binding protein [uncultured Cellulomonas sp.]
MTARCTPCRIPSAGPGRPAVLVVRHAPDALDARSGADPQEAARLVTAARALGEVHVVRLTGAGGGASDDAERVGRYGARALHDVRVGGDAAHPRTLAGAGAGAGAAAVADLAAALGVTTVLLGARPHEQELAALVAHRLGAGLVTGAERVEPGPDARPVAVRRSFAGTWAARVTVERPRAVVTLRTGGLPAVPVPDAAPAPVCPHVAGPPAGDRGWRLVERAEIATGDRPPLVGADVVVVGGGGTGGDFGPVDELADALGGAVGATGVAVAEGWADAATLVGQSGVTVSPRLYVGAGVSGAVHHSNGVAAAATVVAVNPDPQAPIFAHAHLGIVGDLFDVLPQAAAALRRLRT